MNNSLSWLTVLMQKVNLPFIVGAYLSLEDDNKNKTIDLGETAGDNVPHVFFNADSSRRRRDLIFKGLNK